MANKKTKKILFTMLLAVFLLLTLCACGPEKQTDGNISTITYDEVKNASVSKVSDFDYEIVNKKAIITSYSGNKDIVSIPESIDSCPVVEISSSAFNDNRNLKGVMIPNSVEFVGVAAFKNCRSLEIFIAGTGLKSIDEFAFYNCSALRQVELLPGIEEIKDSAFIDTLSLDNIYIPDTVTKIYNAFSSNTILLVENESYAQEYARDNMFNFEVL